jgi:uncharacterized membrane protein
LAKKYNSKEYLRQLERLLRKLPAWERDDALAYYEEYFAEAGPEHEMEAIYRLGSPSQVAAGIKADAAMRELEEGKPRVKKSMTAVWMTLLGIFSLPVTLPLAAAGFAVIVGVLAAIFAVLVSLTASAISVLLSGLITVVAGIALLPQDISVGLFYMGAGLFCLALGLILGVLFWQLWRVSWRGLARFFNWLRHRRIEKRAVKAARMGVAPGMSAAGTAWNANGAASAMPWADNSDDIAPGDSRGEDSDDSAPGDSRGEDSDNSAPGDSRGENSDNSASGDSEAETEGDEQK